MNQLYYGDNKLILSSLKNGPLREEIEKQGGLKLIYIDPPFDVGADFSMDIEIGDETFTKKPNILEEIAYRDTWENGYVESFNGKFRDEFLNGEIFYTLREAKVLIEGWRREYNRVRPHSALGYRPPAPEVILPLPPGFAPLHPAATAYGLDLTGVFCTT